MQCCLSLAGWSAHRQAVARSRQGGRDAGQRSKSPRGGAERAGRCVHRQRCGRNGEAGCALQGCTHCRASFTHRIPLYHVRSSHRCSNRARTVFGSQVGQLAATQATAVRGQVEQAVRQVATEHVIAHATEGCSDDMKGAVREGRALMEGVTSKEEALRRLRT